MSFLGIIDWKNEYAVEEDNEDDEELFELALELEVEVEVEVEELDMNESELNLISTISLMLFSIAFIIRRTALFNK